MKNTIIQAVTFKNALIIKKDEEYRVIDIKHATREMVTTIAAEDTIVGTINNQGLSPKNRYHIGTLIGNDTHRVTTLKPADPTMYKLQYKRMTEGQPKVAKPVIELKEADNTILKQMIDTYGMRSVIAAIKKQK